MNEPALCWCPECTTGNLVALKTARQVREFARVNGAELAARVPAYARKAVFQAAAALADPRVYDDPDYTSTTCAFKARTALGGNPPTGGREVSKLGSAAGKGTTTYAPGFSDAELLDLLERARAGEPGPWQEFARTDPARAGSIIKAASGTVTKGKRKAKDKGTFRRGRLTVTSGESEELANQAAGFERRARRFQPGPLARPVTKQARFRLAPASSPGPDPAIAYYAAAGNPAARALLIGA